MIEEFDRFRVQRKVVGVFIEEKMNGVSIEFEGKGL